MSDRLAFIFACVKAASEVQGSLLPPSFLPSVVEYANAAAAAFNSLLSLSLLRLESESKADYERTELHFIRACHAPGHRKLP